MRFGMSENKKLYRRICVYVACMILLTGNRLAAHIKSIIIITIICIHGIDWVKRTTLPLNTLLLEMQIHANDIWKYADARIYSDCEISPIKFRSALLVFMQFQCDLLERERKKKEIWNARFLSTTNAEAEEKNFNFLLFFFRFMFGWYTPWRKWLLLKYISTTHTKAMEKRREKKDVGNAWW